MNVFTAVLATLALFAQQPPAQSHQPPPSSQPSNTGGPSGPLQQRIAPGLATLTDDVLFGDVWRRSDLTPRDRSLVTIAALAAMGDDDQLDVYLRRGVESGLTRDQIAEALTHLGFYAGWSKAHQGDDRGRQDARANGGTLTLEPCRRWHGLTDATHSVYGSRSTNRLRVTS